MQSQPPTAVNVRVNAIPLLSRPPKSTQGSCIVRSVYVMFIFFYERWLISNAHSEISRKRDHVFKQTKVRSKVQYFSYKLTYLFFDIVALSFKYIFPNVKQVYACRQ